MNRVQALTDGADALWAWIERQGLNQRKAALQIGIGHDYLNHILKRRSKVGLNTALLLERATGIPVEAWASTDVDKTEPVTVSKSRKR